MNTLARTAWSVAAVCVSFAVGCWLVDLPSLKSPALVAALVSFALGFSVTRKLRPYAFTAWVLAFVAGSLAFPAAFGTWFGFDLKLLIVPLIQIIMFGMGTTLSVADFGRVLAMPWPVFVGIFLQFTIMPAVGFLLASGLGLQAEVAAGIILIGSCPGGVASNLMAYLARGNVALSVTMTSCSTLLSPLMTPVLMKLLASQYIDIPFTDMILAICNMIIVPIAAGLVANRILYSGEPRYERGPFLAGTGVCMLAAAALVGFSAAAWLGPLHTGVVLGLALVGVVALAKLVVERLLANPGNWMDRALPLVSMAGICTIIGIITARSADDLLHVGLLLLAAAATHNLIGYLFGYWLARLCRLDERDCRTVAFEVGMQNGGMASGLAMNTLHSVQAALAPAIFGPWMNVSGSMLATFWRGRTVPAVPPAARDAGDAGHVGDPPPGVPPGDPQGLSPPNG